MKRSLPQHTYRRLEYSVRTMYSTSVCLLLSYYYPWSTVFLFLSPMISILSTVMYFGLWQENTFKVLYSSLIGSSIGTIIGFTYRIKALQIILLFVAMVSINRITCWDRTCYVFCGLALMLGALLPILTTGQITGFQSFYSVLAIIWIPYLITGVTLLACPHPALACLSSKIYVLRICQNMNKMILSLIKAFVSMEQIDVHCAEYDILLIEVKTDVTILAELIRHAENEVTIFYPLKQIVPSLHVLHAGLEKMMIELQGMRNGLSKIQSNQTHQQFIKLMDKSLGRISIDVTNCFSIISSYFDSFVLFGVASAVEEDGNNNNNNNNNNFNNNNNNNNNNNAHGTCDMDSADSEDLLKKSGGVSYTINDCCDRGHSFKDYHLSETTTGVLDNNLIEMGTHTVEMDEEERFDVDHHTGFDLEQNAKSIFGPNRNPATDFMYQSIQLIQSKNEMMCRYQEGRRKLVFFTTDDDHVSPGTAGVVVVSVNEDVGKSQDPVEKGSTDIATTIAPPASSSSSSSLSRDHSPLDPALRHQLCEETALLGIGNFGPRSAFIEKLIMLLELLSAMSKMFECIECEWSIMDFMKRMLMHVCEFVLSLLTGVVKEYHILIQLFDSRTVDRWSKFIRHILDLLDDASTNSIKISSAVTICASLKIFHLLPNLYSGGVWTTLVIVLIREDNASSSFLRGYQRLEGTVVGAIYSFAVYELFSCNKGNCQIYQIYPAIMLCVGLSCLFREGPRHGYAAVVAAFTPIVLLDQNDIATIGLEGTFGRIQETFLGIAVYLFIDNMILPSRMYPILKSAVLNSILETQLTFTEIVSTIDTVLMHEGGTAAAAGDHSLHDNNNSNSSNAIFKISHDHLQLVCNHTKSLAASISTQESSLRLVTFEPELWYRTVPTMAYEKLLQRFSAILQSTETLTSGLRSFCSILQQMEENKESISEQLDLYSFMIKDLFSTSKQALVSLNLSYEALQRVYIDRDYSVDLDPIILLRQNSYALMQSCNRKFLHDYLQHTQNIRSKVNPYLNMSWQNLFECSLDMIHDLARLGMELHCIRNVEAWQNTNTMTLK